MGLNGLDWAVFATDAFLNLAYTHCALSQLLTFLGLHSNLLSTDARFLVIILGWPCNIWSIFTVLRYAKCGICRRRVSVTLRYCIKTTKCRIMQIMPQAGSDMPNGHLIAATVMILGRVYIKVIRWLQELFFILTSASQSLCHSRASCLLIHNPDDADV